MVAGVMQAAFSLSSHIAWRAIIGITFIGGAVASMATMSLFVPTIFSVGLDLTKRPASRIHPLIQGLRQAGAEVDSTE